MELQHTFDVPVSPAHAFEVLRDIERIGPCMPGASIDDVDGDHFSGRVKVKIGPIQVTYRGEADYVDVDADSLSATINARGREARGSGTANATVRANLSDNGAGGATVNVTTELNITGKPAQFGRGVMADVGEKLIGRFADCLAEELGRDDEAATPAEDTADSTTPDGAPADSAPADGAPADSAPAADSGSAEPTAVAAAGAVPGGVSVGDAASTNGTTPTAAASPAEPRPSTPKRQPRAEPEALDLLEIAGAPLAQRAVPAIFGMVVLYLLFKLLRRRR